MFGLAGPTVRFAGASLQVSRVLLVATLLMGAGLLVPHEDPASRAERMADVRASAARELDASPPAPSPPAPEAEGGLSLSFEGPSHGTDRADAWERATGRATGNYATEARLAGEGRLSGSLWLYPSVCAPCTLSSTTQPPLEEWGLAGIQYSLTSRHGEAFLRLEGAVDWEVLFRTAGVTTEDPLGPPTAQVAAPFAHEARWRDEEGALREEARAEIPVVVTYEAAATDDLERIDLFATLDGRAAAKRPLYLLKVEEQADGTLLLERVPL